MPKIVNNIVNILDRNGDGKLDQEDIMVLLNGIYDSACNGLPRVDKQVEVFSTEYINRYSTVEKAAHKMIKDSVIKCTTMGFVTSLGGLITLPIAVPANVAGVIYVQMRMIASMAYMAGYDVRDETVQTLIYACLTGISIKEIIKTAGVQFGNKLAVNLIKKIPVAVVTKINQKVGFRFLTKFGEKGIINIGKMVPIVGGVIGGGVDLATTKVIANRAYKEFIKGEID